MLTGVESTLPGAVGLGALLGEHAEVDVHVGPPGIPPFCLLGDLLDDCGTGSRDSAVRNPGRLRPLRDVLPESSPADGLVEGAERMAWTLRIVFGDFPASFSVL